MSTPQGFTFFYGNYEHVPGEVYPQEISFKAITSRQNLRWATQVRMKVGGNFLSEDVNELDVGQITQRITELQDAYQFDYFDCGFRDPDGFLTPHRILTNDTFNLSGNRVLGRSWEGLHPTEYANTRSFSVTIGALFLESYSEILEFREATTVQGDGGPEFEVHALWNGAPYKQIKTNFTPVYHIQRGTIVGLSTWPDPLAISPPYWPAEEQTWLRRITQHSPESHGHPDGKYTQYRVDYQYRFKRPTAVPLPTFTGPF